MQIDKKFLEEELGLTKTEDAESRPVYLYDDGFFIQSLNDKDVWMYIDPSLEICEGGVYSQCPITSVTVFNKLFR